MLLRVVWQKLGDVSEMLAAPIIVLTMKAASTSETSLNFYQTTRRNIPEDCHRRRENLTSQKTFMVLIVSVHLIISNNLP
jgi:hypothetical protein